jgi:hypothetical protein
MLNGLMVTLQGGEDTLLPDVLAGDDDASEVHPSGLGGERLAEVGRITGRSRWRWEVNRRTGGAEVVSLVDNVEVFLVDFVAYLFSRGRSLCCFSCRRSFL